jgi:hypothetical protein
VRRKEEEEEEEEEEENLLVVCLTDCARYLNSASCHHTICCKQAAYRLRFTGPYVSAGINQLKRLNLVLAIEALPLLLPVILLLILLLKLSISLPQSSLPS